MDISIIIVNYNTRDDLRNALASIRTAAAALKVQTIVVDNLSKDDSVAMVRSEFPEVTLIANQDNRGFAAANNQGIEIAGGRYVLLLNPDTILYEDTLTKCVDYMEQHQDIGCLGIKSLTRSGNVFPNGNSFPSEIKTLARLLMLREILPNKLIRKYLAPVAGKLATTYADREVEQDVDMVGGFYLFMRGAAVKQVGMLEEAYWADIEDSDYCARLWQAGWRVVYWPGASMVHLIGASIERRLYSINTVLRVNENTMLFFKRHYAPWRLLVLRLIYVLSAPVQVVMACCLPICMGSEKAQVGERIRGAWRLAKRAVFLPEKVRVVRK